MSATSMLLSRVCPLSLVAASLKAQIEAFPSLKRGLHAKLLNQTDFEWHPDAEDDADQDVNLASEDPNLASEASKCPESEALLSQEDPKSEIDTSKLPQTTVKPARIGSRYKNTHV